MRPQRPPSADALQDLNPARLFVDRRKKLTLADSQVAQMKAVEKRIRDRNAPHFSVALQRRTADVVESLALLTPEQLIKAREFLGEQDQEFDRILPRGRGGRPPG